MTVEDLMEWANQIGVKQHELEKENAELKQEVEELNKRLEFYESIVKCYADVCNNYIIIIEHIQNQTHKRLNQ